MEMRRMYLLLFAIILSVSNSQGVIIDAPDKEYDFVIVGGGTAGCILAARLSENDQHTVLVLEAGISDKDYPQINIPQQMGLLQKTHIDWEFQTEPMRNSSKELHNYQSNWPIGKVLGGSSSHNFLDVVRGSPHDFDYWRDQGNKGWAFQDVLPYFKKAENNRDPVLAQSDYHSTGGPWTVETITYSAIGQWIVQAAEELGHQRLDINGATSEGFDIVQLNTRYGRRMSTATAYLWPVQHRQNLHVITEAYVTQIMLKGKTATGVKYEKDGSLLTVSARREVIMCAGAIMSPQILMLSGIGPRHHLQQFGIDVVTDLPVGLGLEDHYATILSFTINETLSISEKLLNDPQEKLKYIFGGTGVFSIPGHQVNGFEISKYQPPEHKFPYIQHVYIANLIGNHKTQEDLFRSIFNTKHKYFNYEYERGKSGFIVIMLNLHPRNMSGTVKLRSTDPHDKPVINIEYVNHPDDVKDMIQAIRTNMALAKTKTLQHLGIKYEAPHHQGCLQYQFDTDQYWECFLRHRTITAYHPTSTCKMAPGKNGVVDSQLRVKGISNLRVVDASIMPNMTSGNTMTPTIMIAEKAADIIKLSHEK